MSPSPLCSRLADHNLTGCKNAIKVDVTFTTLQSFGQITANPNLTSCKNAVNVDVTYATLQPFGPIQHASW